MGDNLAYGSRWIAYFDILGFQNMLLDFNKQHQGHLDVFVQVYYHDVIEALRESGEYYPNEVSITWFSDSFLFFSHDDTLKSFVLIEQEAGHFFWRAICMGMPLRGALGFGEFYGDLNSSTFLGPALIDAYHYAEHQDWLGFIVAPSAYNRLDGGSIRLSRLDYVEHDVLFKENKSERIYAYKPKSGSMIDPMLRKIREMQSQAKHKYPDKYNEFYKPKYERTIAFLDS
jgi:hypothetical protein